MDEPVLLLHVGPRQAVWMGPLVVTLAFGSYIFQQLVSSSAEPGCAHSPCFNSVWRLYAVVRRDVAFLTRLKGPAANPEVVYYRVRNIRISA